MMFIVQGREVFDRRYGNASSRVYGKNGGIKCANCKQKYHTARNCPWPKVRSGHYYVKGVEVAKFEIALQCTTCLYLSSLSLSPPSVTKYATCVVERITSVLSAQMTFAPTATRRSTVVAHAPLPGPAHGRSVYDASWQDTTPLWVGHVTVVIFWTKANFLKFSLDLHWYLEAISQYNSELILLIIMGCL